MTELALRFNENKPRFDLIILEHIVDSFNIGISQRTDEKILAFNVLQDISNFQQTKDVMFLDLASSRLTEYWYECAYVFEYGSKKYSDWNWLKGMKWSFYIASLSRHLMKILLNDEYYDIESEKSHFGHVLCNIVMFKHTIKNFSELDDIPVFNKKAA
jgi:hypothetical protein